MSGIRSRSILTLKKVCARTLLKAASQAKSLRLLFSDLHWTDALFSELAWNISAFSKGFLPLRARFIPDLSWNSHLCGETSPKALRVGHVVLTRHSTPGQDSLHLSWLSAVVHPRQRDGGSWLHDRLSRMEDSPGRGSLSCLRLRWPASRSTAPVSRGATDTKMSHSSHNGCQLRAGRSGLVSG